MVKVCTKGPNTPQVEVNIKPINNNPTQTDPDNNQAYPQKKPRKKREKPVDKQLVAAMLADGYSKAHIAKEADCSEVTVYDINKHILGKENEIKTFLANRANLLALEQKERIELASKLRKSIEVDLEAGLMKPSEKGKITFYLDQGFGIFWDKEHDKIGKLGQTGTTLQIFIGIAHDKV